MAISVQQGRQATASSELEPILYMAIKISSIDWHVHWQDSRPSDSDEKVAAMQNGQAFKVKVRNVVRQSCIAVTSEADDRAGAEQTSELYPITADAGA